MLLPTGLVWSFVSLCHDRPLQGNSNGEGTTSKSKKAADRKKRKKMVKNTWRDNVIGVGEVRS